MSRRRRAKATDKYIEQLYAQAGEEAKEEYSEEEEEKEAVRLYLREIGRVPLLTAEEEIELVSKVERVQKLENIENDIADPMLESLSTAEKTLLSLRFGMRDVRRLTLEEVAMEPEFMEILDMIRKRVKYRRKSIFRNCRR